MMDVRDKLLKMLAKNPKLTNADLSRELGVSRQRISQITSKLGIKLQRAVVYEIAERRHSPPQARVDLVGAPIISHAAAGTVSELLVAADLTARGWQVFFPLVRSTHCDLVVTSHDGTIVKRVEVRSGVRREGRIVWQKKATTECEVYAIVLRGEPIRYEPDIGFGKPRAHRNFGLDHP